MPTPKQNEPKQDFISRCISTVTKENNGMKKEQIIAYCYILYKQKNSKKRTIKKGK